MEIMTLLTAPTPNGWKVSIMLEELREAGVVLPDITVQQIDLLSGEQFKPSFSEYNPNQKIPVLLHGEMVITESCAIVHYLAETFTSALLKKSHRWQVLPWLYWQAASLGPAFGNKLSYTRYMDNVADDLKAHPLQRFSQEAQRLSGILEQQLQSHNYVCGNDFSIADIVIYPWVRGWKWSKVDMSNRPAILTWLKRIRARPGVERGLAYGAKDGEVDQWSAATKAHYAKGGNAIASNQSIKMK